MKTSYLIPFLSVLSLGAVAACDPADDTQGMPDPDDGCDVRYRDTDGDRKGDPGEWTTRCAPGAGWVSNSDDCDDTNPYINADEEEICDGVDNDCRATTDEADVCKTAKCRPAIAPATRKAYLVCEPPANFSVEGASDLCDQHGFHLAAVESEDENEYLAKQLRTLLPPGEPPTAWIGGRHAEGVWRWADGRQFWPDPRTGGPAPYADWVPGRPSATDFECMVLAANGIETGWYPAVCFRNLSFVCERD